MMKLETADNFFHQYNIFNKTRGRMTTVLTFSRQNDAGSRLRTT